MERIKHYSLRLLVAFSAFVFLLAIVSLIVLNSGMLDRFAKERAVELFNKKLFGRLELQEVHLSFPNNVTFINPRIYAPGEREPAIMAHTVSAKLNFLTILQPEIRNLTIRRLAADSLTAHIIEQKNGKLNLELIFTSRDPDSTKRPLDHFFCKNLQVSKGALFYSGSKNLPGDQQLGVTDINLELTALTVREHFLKGTVEKLRLNIPQHRFALQQTSGKFLFSPTRSELLSLKAVSNKSHVEVSGTVEHFNIFAPKRLQQLALSTTFLNVQELGLHSDDLKLFYPSLALPPGIYTFKGNARGKGDTIRILDALLTHGKSRLAAKGELLNLLNSNALAFQLQCDSSRIAEPFIESFLQESSQKEIARKTGDITFTGTAKGTLSAVKADVMALSLLGKATVSGEVLRERSEQFTCKGSLALKDFDLYKLVGSESKKSMLNASAFFAGRATTSAISQLTLDMKIANSFWLNQSVKEGSMTVSYNDDLLNTIAAFKDNATSFTLDAGLDFKDKLPRYHASGKTARLDVSKILGSNRFTTDLNGVFALKGSGFDPARLNVAAVMQFLPSAINGFQLKERSKASLDITQSATSSRIGINSDFLDFAAEGNYTLEKLMALGKVVGSSISREINAQNIWSSSPPAPLDLADLPKEPFTINYRIAIKDISPLILLLPVEGLTLRGSAEGRSVYRNGQCSISSSINLETLHTPNNLICENFSLEAGAECNGHGVTKASAVGKGSSIMFGGKKASLPLFSALYTPARLESSFDLAIPDPAQGISAKFTATKTDRGYELSFNHLGLKEQSGIWQAVENSRVTLGRTSATFNHFTITKGVQRAVFDGELSSSQTGSFQCTLSDIELKELKVFVLNPSLDRMEGTINASLTVSGSPGSKTSSLKVSGQGVRYDKISLGTLQASALHSGSQLRFEMHSNASIVDVATKRAVSMNTIEGSGSIPLVVSYYPFQVKLAERQAISASFRSDNLSAQFLEYVMPLFDSAEGIIPTTVKIEGMMPDPDIYLNARLRDTKIRIEPTQVSYRLDGELYATSKAIELRDITVSDSIKGTGRINGVVQLEKLKATALDLGARFNNLLLFNKEDKKDETSFGTVTGTSENILVHGSLAAPLLEGELRVNAADFSLYRLGANESAKYVGVDKFIEFVPRYPLRNVADVESKNNPDKPAEFYHSLIDILQIKDLRLSSIEPLKCTVIFDRIRGEQLESSINNLTLNVSKTNQQYRLFGSVNVVGGKYRFSNSNFDLQDGGKIGWNNVDIRNGVMDNLYGSKYVSAINQQSGERDNVNLLLAITGTLNEPQVVMGYYLNEQTQPYASTNMIGVHSSQIDPNSELNVISMLLSKQWYIRPGSGGQNGNIAVSTVGFSAGTGILSSRISKVIQDIGGLESFNVNVGMDKRGALSGLDLYFALSVPGTGGKVRFIGTGNSPGLGASTMSDYYGTGQKIEYRVTPNVYVEASRSYGQSGSALSSTNLQKPAETWGVSLSYKERFHTWDQFWKRIIPSADNKR